MADTIYTLDPDAANNTALDGIAYDNNQLTHGNIDNLFRATHAVLAQLVDDLGAVNTVGGTGNALTVTLASGITAYATGQLFRFIAGAANTGAATMNVNSIGAKAIRKISGGTDVALAADDILAGETYTVIYRASANGAAGAWVIVAGRLGNVASSSITVSSTSAGALATLTSTDAGATAGPVLTLYRDSATPAASDVLGKVLFNGEDSAGNTQEYASVETVVVDATSTSEDGQLDFYVTKAGTRTKFASMTATATAFTGAATYTVDATITPAANNGAALGTSSLMWSDLFLASGAVVNFNNGDVTITHSANTLAFAGANNGYSFGNNILQSAGYFQNTDGGSAATPSIQPGNDADTGMYHVASNRIGFTTAGVKALEINSSGQLLGVGGSVTLPTFAFDGDANTGMYQSGADELAFTVGGAQKLRMTSTVTKFLGINDTTTGSAANVFISSADGTVARSTSSLRYKKNVRDYDKGLAALLTLRPVYFEGLSEADAGKTFAGLIAEELDAAGFREFVVYDAEGRPDAIHYPMMIALSIKAISELSERVAALEAKE